ncbi:MAG: hypothetical protein AABZ55_13060, partial [Bdellovibrionota bacterium]
DKRSSGGQKVVKDGEVDLSSLDTAVAGAPPISVGGTGKYGTHGESVIHPNFKTYFDLALIVKPGQEDFSFDNYHSFLFFEILPTPDIQFSFEVSTAPRFFELDYQLTPIIQLRIGKIWIPFDDMAPHNIFGGRVNVSKLKIASGNDLFLPDLWTDLGVGAKFSLIDRPKLSLTGHVYMVNGFNGGGADPTGATTNYPKFADTGGIDQNRNKLLGGRLQTTLVGMFSFGGSYAFGRWNPESESQSQGLSILGLDAQVRVRNSELRVGMAKMAVNTLGGSFNRDGAYAEIAQRFGTNNAWKVLGRAGEVQLDSRRVASSDQQIMGGSLLFKPGLIEWSIEHSRDLKIIPGKQSYTYTAARAIMAF